MSWTERSVRLLRRFVPRWGRHVVREPVAALRLVWYEAQWRLGRSATTTPVQGWTFRCHPASRGVFGSASARHDFEDFRRWVSPGMHLVDVGANMGCYTLAALHFGGEASRVLAVEPCGAARRILGANVELAGASSRVTVAPVALGSSEGVGAFLTAGPRALYQLVPAEETRLDAVRVPVVTLDDLLARTGFVPTHLKIDVEGCEGDVLAGARATLRKCRPIVFLELHGALLRGAGRDPEGVLARLIEDGYERFEFQGRVVSPGEAAAMWVANLVCPPPASLGNASF